MKGLTKKPNILEYSDYRLFLQDMYRHLKICQPAFSFRYFSLKAGFRSPNFYKLVMDGQRNLSRASIAKFAKILKLSAEESRFFTLLVLLAQSRTLAEKQAHTEGILQFRSYQNIHPLAREQYDYLAQWYVVPVREMIVMPAFRQNPQTIAKKFLTPVTPKQVEAALRLLQKLGLIAKNADGQWLQSQALLSTGDLVSSTAATSFHHQMMTRAQEALTRDHKNRDISSVTIALSQQTFQKLQKRIQKFRKELLALADQESAPDAVYQMNFQLFPLTSTNEDES